MLTHLRQPVPIVAFVAVVGLVLVQQFAGIAGEGRVLAGLHNAAHGPWFATLTYFVHAVVRPRLTARMALAVTGLLAVLIAVGTEALQHFTGGDAQWLDVGFDLLGSAAALTFIAGQRALAALILTVSLAPAAVALTVQAHRNAQFPSLISFAAPWQGGLLETNSAIALVNTPAQWAGVEDAVLMVTFADTTWPGVTLPEPVPDWSGYRVLEVELFAPAPLALTVSVRLTGAPAIMCIAPSTCQPARGASRCRLLNCSTPPSFASTPW
ncbi:MAG: hypothetical protein HC809_00305 [Gammaproteobacteria bacterium]|nr:hypothetical protein [Gammaproteobacteria bacterium]